MSLGLSSPECGPTSPGSSHSSPSPPAVVPTANDHPHRTKAQRRDEELAFANFLHIEEQRQKKTFAHKSYIEIQKQIVTKWMAMRPVQRLKYLHNPKEANENIDKANLKRKLDEHLDSHIQIGSKRPANSSGTQKLLLPTGGTPVVRPVGAENYSTLASYLGQPPIKTAPGTAMTTPTQGKFFVVRKPEVTLSSRPLAPIQSPAPQPTLQSGPYSAREALDLFYLACCAPAFPGPEEEPLTQHNANYYFDAYIRLTRI